MQSCSLFACFGQRSGERKSEVQAESDLQAITAEAGSVEAVLTDSGFYSENAVRAVEQSAEGQSSGTTVYAAMERKSHHRSEADLERKTQPAPPPSGCQRERRDKTPAGDGGRKAKIQAAATDDGTDYWHHQKPAEVSAVPLRLYDRKNFRFKLGRKILMGRSSDHHVPEPNTVTADFGTIDGGVGNPVSGSYATLGGGYHNTASGDYATIGGGSQNIASGDYSFAAGNYAHVQHTGSFVWADQVLPVPFSSTTANQFRVRSTGGVAFATGVDSSGNVTLGVHLLSGDTAWSSISDKNAKKNFQPVNGGAVLEKLAAIPVKQWNYKWEADTSTLHTAGRIVTARTMKASGLSLSWKSRRLNPP